jgi:hypothetical protein
MRLKHFEDKGGVPGVAGRVCGVHVYSPAVGFPIAAAGPPRMCAVSDFANELGSRAMQSDSTSAPEHENKKWPSAQSVHAE